MAFKWLGKKCTRKDGDRKSDGDGREKKARRRLKDLFSQSSTRLQKRKAKTESDGELHRGSQAFKHDQSSSSPGEMPLPKSLLDHHSPETTGQPTTKQSPNIVTPPRGVSELELQWESEPPKDPDLLTEEAVQALLSGAPHYAFSFDHDALKPSISFPWDFELDIRDVSDCPPLAHPAFSASTLARHLPRPSPHGYTGPESAPGYDIGVAEVPSMLHVQGSEPGSVGLETFLQIPVADRFREGPSSEAQPWQNRQLLSYSPEKLGIRPFDLELVTDRLGELGQQYRAFKAGATANGSQETILDRQDPAELYTQLFGTLLTPPRFDAQTADPTGLKVQIEALIRVLRLEGLWYDFSSVEWRIRVGQLLWAGSDFEEPETPGYSNSQGGDGISDRDVLLLQLSLACELLLRLDAVVIMRVEDIKSKLHITTAEVDRFQDLQNRKVSWDLVLAHRFMESILVKSNTHTSDSVARPKPRRFFSFSPTTPEIEEPQSSQTDVVFLPCHQDLQLDGLLYFTKTIGWPDHDDIEIRLRERLSAAYEAEQPIATPSIYMTPISTPHPVSPHGNGNTNDYFNTNARPQLQSRKTTQLHLSPPLPDPVGSTRPSFDGVSINLTNPIGGWLTRTYLTALILPGEAITHLLISSMLENSPSAITVLGDSANLYGGFVYNGRSWWSKACIVGRVLACVKGSGECMGWIGVPLMPLNPKEGWVDIPSDVAPIRKITGVEAAEAVIEAAGILGGNSISQIRKQDLVVPVDLPKKPVCMLFFDGLVLHEATDASVTKEKGYVHDLWEEENASLTRTATLTFSSASISSEIGHPAIPLRHDVYFISAYPCTVPKDGKLQSLLALDVSEVDDRARRGHPIPATYSYTIFPASVVLEKGFVLPGHGTTERTEESLNPKEVMILDARGDTVLELLARSWCAWKGEHSLVSRVGTTCLGCCIREARGAGVRVVIRVGR